MEIGAGAIPLERQAQDLLDALTKSYYLRAALGKTKAAFFSSFALPVKYSLDEMKVARFFLYSAALILFVTAVAKFISITGHSRILAENDPIIDFQFRHLILIVACIETAVALACFFSKRAWLSAGLTAWLATSFVIYRLGLMLIGYHKPCSCLGNLTDALHIPPQTADTVMKIILAYLLIGSYATLFWLWRQRKKTSQAPQARHLGSTEYQKSPKPRRGGMVWKRMSLFQNLVGAEVTRLKLKGIWRLLTSSPTREFTNAAPPSKSTAA